MQILIVEEENVTTFLDASTEEKLHKVALSVVKYRLHPEWGFYYEEDSPESLNVTQEDIDKLPNGRGKDVLVEQLKRYEYGLKEYERRNEHYLNAKKAVETNDGKLAWRILQSRSDYEYERVYLAKVQNEYEEE